MSTGQIAAAVLAAAVAVFAFARRRRLPTHLKVNAGVAVVVLAVIASGALPHIPSFESIVKHLANALGKWTYALVGGMAFLETGAFVGFIAPGEFTVILGGVIAGEGEISILPLIGLVWICAIAGDSLSFLIGSRVGRRFMLKYGPRVRITEERFAKVEDYFDRHGGKTIVIGRFIGFVRPLAPFIAGSSRMTYGRFIPYSIIGTGLWGTTFCLLGYVFWRSFDKVSKIAGRATLGLAIIAAIVVAIVFLRRKLGTPEGREQAEQWLRARPPLWRTWRFVGRPVTHFIWPQIRFIWGRITPGHLGIELTSSLAVIAGGSYVFAALAIMLNGHPHRLIAGDHAAFSLASNLYSSTAVDIVKVVTTAGSLPFVATFVVVGCVMLLLRRRPLELFALAGGFLLVVLAVHLAKAGVDRPRPSGAFVHHLVGSSYPSGHSAYATAYVALAIVASRVLAGIFSRAAFVLAAVAVAAIIGATRIYLRAHYLSDVLGGFGLGVTIFAACGAIALVVGYIRNNAAPIQPPTS